MSEIVFRAANTSDAALLAEMRVLFLEDFWGAPDMQARDMLQTELVSYFQQAVEHGDYIGWFAFCQGQAVGAGGAVIRVMPGNFVNPSGRSAYVMSMLTLPAYRRQGIAARILRELQQDALRAGVSSFELHAAPAGLNVYLADGFTIHNQHTMRKRIVADALP